jgi:RES domain-containing protein
MPYPIDDVTMSLPLRPSQKLHDPRIPAGPVQPPRERTDLPDLTDPLSRARVGLDPPLLAAADWSPCQAIGDAAHYVGFEAVLVPSAAGSGQTLAIFLDRLLRGSILEVSSVTPLELDS